MRYLMACDKNTKRTGSISKYFGENRNRRLFMPNTLPDMLTIADLWEVIRLGEPVEGLEWSKNLGIRQMLDVLDARMGNWTFAVISYYLAWRKSVTFEEDFLAFLHRLVAAWIASIAYGSQPRGLQFRISVLCTRIPSSPSPEFPFDRPTREKDLRDGLINTDRLNLRPLLTLLEYLIDPDQQVIDDDWEVEHIFPRQWNANVYTQRKSYIVNYPSLAGGACPCPAVAMVGLPL